MASQRPASEPRGAEPLAAGELVVISGAVQLASSLHDRQSSAAPAQ